MKNFYINSQVIIYGFFILKSKIMDFKPSIYQIIVFNKFKNSDKNLIISAVAGSGKTTTIVSWIDFIPKGKDSIFFAFNNPLASFYHYAKFLYFYEPNKSKKSTLN